MRQSGSGGGAAATAVPGMGTYFEEADRLDDADGADILAEVSRGTGKVALTRHPTPREQMK